jgi:glycosyl transferase family 25
LDSIYLINLQAASERRLHMMAQLAGTGLRVQRIGIDARGHTPGELERLAVRELPGIRFAFDKLSAAEVGCWLSHLVAWRTFLGCGRSPCGVVIEDDLQLATGFAHTVRAIAQQEHYDAVFFGTSSKNLSRKRVRDVAGLRVREPNGTIFNTWGYALHRRYIEAFFAHCPGRVAVPIDHVLGGSRRQGAPSIAVLQPAIVSEAAWLGARSQIDAGLRRVDRWTVVQRVRRRFLESRVSDLYYAMFSRR